MHSIRITMQICRSPVSRPCAGRIAELKWE
jgi:hypothetical protein